MQPLRASAGPSWPRPAALAARPEERVSRGGWACPPSVERGAWGDGEQCDRHLSDSVAAVGAPHLRDCVHLHRTVAETVSSQDRAWGPHSPSHLREAWFLPGDPRSSAEVEWAMSQGPRVRGRAGPSKGAVWEVAGTAGTPIWGGASGDGQGRVQRTCSVLPGQGQTPEGTAHSAPGCLARASLCLTKVPGAPYLPTGFAGDPGRGKCSLPPAPLSPGAAFCGSRQHSSGPRPGFGGHAAPGQGWGPSSGWHPPGCGLLGHLEGRHALFFVSTSLQEGRVQAPFSEVGLT